MSVELDKFDGIAELLLRGHAGWDLEIIREGVALARQKVVAGELTAQQFLKETLVSLRAELARRASLN